ncbi:MAG: signal peptidase I [Lysinibacillus sp.]
MAERENEWFSLFKMVIFVSVFVLAVRIFLLTPVVVDGASMLPTFEDGDRVVVNKQAKIHRFDIIVFAVDDQTNYIKRVIGLPGDHIAYKKDILYINGQPYEEPYLQQFKENIPLDTLLTENFTLEKYTGYTTIPEGYLFVLGDNRKKSTDSRDPILGLVSVDSVLGEVKAIFYPFQNSKFVN